MESTAPTMVAEQAEASSAEEVPHLDPLDQLDQIHVKADRDRLASPVSPTPSRRSYSSSSSKASRRKSLRRELSASDEQSFQSLLKKIVFHAQIQQGNNNGRNAAGFFRNCLGMKAGAASPLTENWAYSLLGASAILCHCVVLVVIADSTEAVQNVPAQTISWICMGFFVLDLIIRLLAAKEVYFWRNGWMLLDLFLVASSIIELILSNVTDVVGKGHFLFASFRLMRLLLMFNGRRLLGNRIAHAASVVIMCFGSTKLVVLGVLICVCLAWAIFAVAWSQVFRKDELMPYFSTFREAFYTQVLVSTGGLDWSRRIIDPLQKSNDAILVVKSIAILFFFFFMIVFTENIVICNFVEYASQAAHKCESDVHNKRVTAMMPGIEIIQQILIELVTEEHKEEEHSPSLEEAHLPDRQKLKDALKEQEAELRERMINIKAVLSVYDSHQRAQGRDHAPTTCSEFLFQLVRASHPSDSSKDLLEVEHLQRQCILAVEGADLEMDHKIRSCTQELEDMKGRAHRLESDIDELGRNVHAAQEEISRQVKVVEEQYQKCQKDEKEKEVVRGLQEKEHLHQERQELTNKIAALRKEAAWIRQQRLQSVVFGLFEDSRPPPSGQSAESVAEDAGTGQKAMDTDKFRRAADKLREAVRKKLKEPVLKERLETEFERVW